MVNKLFSCVIFFITFCGIYCVAIADSKAIDEVEVIGVKGGLGLGLSDNNSTSNRLDLTIADSPASVEIIDKENMRIKGDESPLSAVTRATGFSANASPGNGGTSMTVRGFAGHDSIAQTYDGVRLFVGAGSVTFPADTWGLACVEVLRGPGSMTNGIGAIGATINYSPKSATFTPINNEVFLAAGTLNERRIGLGSGGEINDQVAYRVDALNHISQGYVDNGDEARQVFGGALRYQILSSLGVTLRVDYADVDAPTYFGTPLVNGRVLQATRGNNYNVQDAVVSYQDLWPKITIDWQINDDATLTSQIYFLNAKRHWRNVESYKATTQAAPVIREAYFEIKHVQEQVGNRTDLLAAYDVGVMTGKTRVGFELNLIDFTHWSNSPYSGESQVDIRQPDAGFWQQGHPMPISHAYSSDSFQQAFFVDQFVQLSQRAHVVGGLRVDQVNVDRHDQVRKDQEAARIKTDYLSTSWRLGLVYQPLTDMHLYGQVSKAVDPVQSVLSTTLRDPELSTGRQVEVGIKQTFADKKCQYTLALFDIKKNNLVTNDNKFTPEQIGQQSSKGIELDVFAAPVDALDVSLNLACYAPRYDAYREFNGKTPKNVPKKTANLWINWRVIERWQLSGGVRYVGERFQDNANTHKIPAYTVYDASLQWQVNDALRLALQGKNLSDTHDYVLSAYDESQWLLGAPRRAEISMHYQF